MSITPSTSKESRAEKVNCASSTWTGSPIPESSLSCRLDEPTQPRGPLDADGHDQPNMISNARYFITFATSPCFSRLPPRRYVCRVVRLLRFSRQRYCRLEFIRAHRPREEHHHRAAPSICTSSTTNASQLERASPHSPSRT